MAAKTVLVSMLALALVGAGCSSSEPKSEGRGGAPQLQVAAASVSAEHLTAMEQLSAYLNATNAAGQAEWLNANAVSNYMVWNGTYTPEQCIATARSILGILVNATFVSAIRPDSVRPNPGAVQAILGAVPEGSLYSVDLDVSIGVRGEPEPRATTVVTQDIVVLPDGNAKQFARC